MRCKACNTELTDYESTRRASESNEFIDLCNECYSSISDDVAAFERADLMDNEDVNNLGLDI